MCDHPLCVIAVNVAAAFLVLGCLFVFGLGIWALWRDQLRQVK